MTDIGFLPLDGIDVHIAEAEYDDGTTEYTLMYYGDAISTSLVRAELVQVAHEMAMHRKTLHTLRDQNLELYYLARDVYAKASSVYVTALRIGTSEDMDKAYAAVNLAAELMRFACAASL